MAADLIIAPEAEADLTEAYGWYENQRVGLGEAFPAKVDACIQFLRRSPEIHARVLDCILRVIRTSGGTG
jgi:hypothetical protein